jgi:hypothetical protein
VLTLVVKLQGEAPVLNGLNGTLSTCVECLAQVIFACTTHRHLDSGLIFPCKTHAYLSGERHYVQAQEPTLTLSTLRQVPALL